MKIIGKYDGIRGVDYRLASDKEAEAFKQSHEVAQNSNFYVSQASAQEWIETRYPGITALLRGETTEFDTGVKWKAE